MQMRFVTILVSFTLAACGGDQPAQSAPQQSEAPASSPVGADVSLPDGVTQDMVAAGQQIFNQQTCFTCHGRDGVGTPLAPALTNGEWINTDGSFASLVDVIRQGVAQPEQYPAPMPPMGGGQLTDEQIRSLAAYVYAIGHDR